MNILVIDDEKIILNAVVRILKSRGYNVYSLNTGNDLEGKLREFRPSFVFLDVKMQCCSGIDVLKMIKETDPSIKVVMMSGYTSPETLEQAKVYGADAFLKKPFDDITDITGIIDELSRS
ncbi:MAG: response regulator [Oligoflexia bacterium]|nr:response regulator [Oligoflexia bacterium]